MLGLNHDFPLLLPTVLEHAATNFPTTEVISHGRGEIVRSTYADVATRIRSRFVRRLIGLEFPSAP